MEQFSQLGGRPRGGGFIYASSSVATASTTTTTTTPPTTGLAAPPITASMSIYRGPNPNANTLPRLHPPKPEGSSSSSSHHYPFARPTDVDAMKARIISHPHCSNLLKAYMDCQKVGAPPEVADRLSAVAREFEGRQRAGVGCRDPPADPELDQFMEAFYHLLVKYREEITRPLQESTDFLRRVESQLNSLTNGSFHILSSDEKRGVCSSEEDQEVSGGGTELPEIDPCTENAELKHHLLKKYSGYLSSLRQELSKKKKKGKLPKEARQKLLGWWELHYKWPYPSETEKVALAESTGLDQKQINNWFINQRKRHWKPSEDMQFVVMDGYHPQNAAALYMDGHFMGDGLYRLGP